MSRKVIVLRELDRWFHCELDRSAFALFYIFQNQCKKERDMNFSSANLFKLFKHFKPWLIRLFLTISDKILIFQNTNPKEGTFAFEKPECMAARQLDPFLNCRKIWIALISQLFLLDLIHKTYIRVCFYTKSIKWNFRIFYKISLVCWIQSF